MAKVLKNGLISGRVGNIVYYVMYGRQYSRAYAKPGNPKTAGQKIHRAKIKACGEFLKPFSKVIKIGYQGVVKPMEEFNEALQNHLAHALEDITPADTDKFAFRIVPEKVQLSRGTISQPEITSITRNVNEIRLTWNAELGPTTNRLTDSLAVVAYIQGIKVFTDFHCGIRSVGTGNITLPNEFTGPTHIWAFFWNGQKSAEPDRRNVSDSVYLGEL